MELRARVVEAARSASFSPLIIDGLPRIVSGRLNYDFGATALPAAVPMLVGQTTGGLSTTERPIGVKVVDPNEKQGTAAIVYPDGKKPSTVSGGVLNGKATSLAKPAYPAAAKAVRAGGAVSVQVIIYKDGTMYSAAAISGHPLLRRSSETAACSSSFMPTLLEGRPVKVSGVKTYNYVP
jgi:outer membrane biosynthesis protein TonB